MKYFVIMVCFVVFSEISYSQTFSTSNGSWTSGSTWNTNPSYPPTMWASGSISIGTNVTRTGFLNTGSATITITASGSLTVTGNLETTGGSTLNVYGTLIVDGNLTLNSYINIMPGGKVIVEDNITIVSNQYLVVGTSVAPVPYADLVVKGNLIETGGEMAVRRNGRVAIGGNFTSNNWGNAGIVVENGGQVYVAGDLDLNSNSDYLTNNNTAEPFGFYVGGNVSSDGPRDSNIADEETMQDTNLPFYNWVQEQLYGVLPVTFLFFESKSRADGIDLTWATVTEENADYFIIERSSNGIGFTSIGKESASGNSKNLIRYSFTDELPLEGRNYYRLKTVDYDGSFEYSKIISANWDTPKIVNVYPNPSLGTNISFKTNFSPQENDKIIVMNSVGNEVAKIDATRFDSEITFNSTLKPGIYFVKYVSSNFEKIIRVSVVN